MDIIGVACTGKARYSYLTLTFPSTVEGHTWLLTAVQEAHGRRVASLICTGSAIYDSDGLAVLCAPKHKSPVDYTQCLRKEYRIHERGGLI